MWYFILRGDVAGKNTVFHAPVKFEILGFLVFHKVFFQTSWKENIQKTLLSVSFIALYLFVSIDFNYNIFLKAVFSKWVFLSYTEP